MNFLAEKPCSVVGTGFLKKICIIILTAIIQPRLYPGISYRGYSRSGSKTFSSIGYYGHERLLVSTMIYFIPAVQQQFADGTDLQEYIKML